MSDQTTLKKKLEVIKQQREEDAKDLKSMMNARDSATEEMLSTRKALEEVATTKETLQQELNQVGLIKFYFI